MATTEHVTVSLGPPSVLVFLVFLVLKLTGTVGWSWLWVTSPLWIGMGLAFLFFMLFFGFVAFLAVVAALFR